MILSFISCFSCFSGFLVFCFFPLKIQYTICDEAPQLATYALLPVVRRFTAPYGIDVDTPDISLAARILAQFPDRLTPSQRVSDDLAMLGELAQKVEANIIKLPNISASVPQVC